MREARADSSGGSRTTGPTFCSGSARARAGPSGGSWRRGRLSAAAARERTPRPAEVPGYDQLPSEAEFEDDESLTSSPAPDDSFDRQLSDPDSPFKDAVLSLRYVENDPMYHSDFYVSMDENFNDFQENVYAPLHSARGDACSNRTESSGTRSNRLMDAFKVTILHCEVPIFEMNAPD